MLDHTIKYLLISDESFDKKAQKTRYAISGYENLQLAITDYLKRGRFTEDKIAKIINFEVKEK